MKSDLNRQDELQLKTVHMWTETAVLVNPETQLDPDLKYLKCDYDDVWVLTHTHTHTVLI